MSGRGRSRDTRATFVIAALTAVGTVSACTEDPLSIGGDAAPGQSVETVEFTVLASDLPVWRDTTLTGFALPANASFSLVSNRADRSARTLARLNVPDTISTFADTLPVDEFSDVSVRVQIDTIASVFSGLPVTLRMLELTGPYVALETTWTSASSGQPWTTPGGDVGVQLASLEVTELSDSLVLTLDVDQDSLLKAWQESDGQSGFAFVVEGPETEIRIAQVAWRYDALLVGRTEPVVQSQLAQSRTFVTDPAVPPHGIALRVGGLPASRFYLDFSVPPFIDGVPLAGATINHAELVLTPLAPAAAPFTLERFVSGRIVPLLGDPFVLGPKTPVGGSPLTITGLEPDSLAAGVPLRLDVTREVQRASADPDDRIRIGLRADPDAQVLEFWEFGSVESSAAFQPVLRIVATPRLESGGSQ